MSSKINATQNLWTLIYVTAEAKHFTLQFLPLITAEVQATWHKIIQKDV